MFTPSPGFVVKTSIVKPWMVPPQRSSCDGRKISEHNPAAPVGTKMFVNICGHDIVPAPIDQVDVGSNFTPLGGGARRGGEVALMLFWFRTMFRRYLVR